VAVTLDYEEIGAQLARLFMETGKFPTINSQLTQLWGVRPPAALFRLQQAVKQGYVAYYQNGNERGHYHPTAKALVAAHERGWIKLRGSGRPRPVVAIYSEAGGVGKSTLAREMAVAAARAGLRVLVIDTDAQATLTEWLLGESKDDVQENDTILPVFNGQALPEPKKSSYGPDVIPAHRSLGELESVIRNALGGTAALRFALERLGDYDLIVLDTRGGEGAAVNAALTASNLLIAPLQTSLKGLQGVVLVKDYAKKQAMFAGLDDAFLGVVPFMYRPRGTADASIYDTLAAVLEETPGRLFSPVHMRPGLFRNAELEGPLGFDGPTAGDIHFAVAQILTEIAQRRNLIGGASHG